nr:CHC2 zinc finger domain-containing protein [Loigolactobacillus coryniformis]
MATRIPEEVVEQIRGAVNITDVVGQYVQLKKSGRNLFGLCPFHEERTPSFRSLKTSKFFIALVAVVVGMSSSLLWKLKVFLFQKR